LNVLIRGTLPAIVCTLSFPDGADWARTKSGTGSGILRDT